MVVIPARNEEGQISRAVRSFPADTVIVVDDFSEDRTAEAARQAGAGVLPAPDLVRGALGKSNACVAGAKLLRSRWVLFADADTYFEPNFVGSAVRMAESSRLDLLSIHPRAEGDSRIAGMQAPLIAALTALSINPRSDVAGAFNGQCLLVRREAYEFIGGHAAVWSEFREDVKLARIAARHRMKLGVARAEGLARTRFQTADIGLQLRRLPLVGAWALFAAAVFWSLWIPVIVLLLIARQWSMALVFAILPFVLMDHWYPGWEVLLLPFGVCVTVPRVLAGLWSRIRSRPVIWKGRVI